MDKSLFKKSFLLFGGDALLRAINRTPRILFWHGVDQRVDPDVEQEIIDVGVFKQQIEYLNKHYDIISIEEFDRRYKFREFTGREVVLTFDDGYANNLYVVAPILKQWNLPFTVFISSEHIETGLLFPTSVNRIISKGSSLKRLFLPSRDLEFPLNTAVDKRQTCDAISQLLKTLTVDEVKNITKDLVNNVSESEWDALKYRYKSVRPMTWNEVRDLSDIGATIGSHCKWHICCHNHQPETEIKSQLQESKLQIESHLQKECRFFAYPNGDYTDFSNCIVKGVYALGFSTNGKQRIVDCNDSSIIPRISVPGVIDSFRILTNYYPQK